MPVPVLAQMLFSAIHEHETSLSKVSRLLHDDVSQVLSAVGLQLDAMRIDFREAAPGIDERAAEIQGMLEQVIRQLRTITNELNPSIVERTGLSFALERLIDTIRNNFSGTIRLQFDPATRVPTNLAKKFYKIAECAVQSALTRPQCSSIELQVKKSQGQFVLEVTDNGQPGPLDSGDSMARLLLEYYASDGTIVLNTTHSAERGNLVRASCPAQDKLG